MELESGAFRKWKEVACRILKVATSNEPVLQVSESSFWILGKVFAEWQVNRGYFGVVGLAVMT